MKCVAPFRNVTKAMMILLTVVGSEAAAQETKSRPQASASGRVAFLKAFIIDDRLSALRREPSLHSEVVRRLHLGRSVYIIRGSTREHFHRVAVSRRTRGWIHESALAIQGRVGEDQRIMNLVETSADKTNSDVLDRITLCRTLIEHFSSRLVPRALLHIGEEADRAAETLSQRAKKRLQETGREDSNISSRVYYLSDSGLDRYSRLRILFDFNESTSEYVYDGDAYREIVRRFPDTEQAKVARERLEAVKQKLARRQ